jgi:hypothetical protein
VNGEGNDEHFLKSSVPEDLDDAGHMNDHSNIVVVQFEEFEDSSVPSLAPNDSEKSQRERFVVSERMDFGDDMVDSSSRNINVESDDEMESDLHHDTPVTHNTSHTTPGRDEKKKTDSVEMKKEINHISPTINVDRFPSQSPNDTSIAFDETLSVIQEPTIPVASISTSPPSMQRRHPVSEQSHGPAPKHQTGQLSNAQPVKPVYHNSATETEASDYNSDDDGNFLNLSANSPVRQNYIGKVPSSSMSNHGSNHGHGTESMTNFQRSRESLSSEGTKISPGRNNNHNNISLKDQQRVARDQPNSRHHPPRRDDVPVYYSSRADRREETEEDEEQEIFFLEDKHVPPSSPPIEVPYVDPKPIFVDREPFIDNHNDDMVSNRNHEPYRRRRPGTESVSTPGLRDSEFSRRSNNSQERNGRHQSNPNSRFHNERFAEESNLRNEPYFGTQSSRQSVPRDQDQSLPKSSASITSDPVISNQPAVSATQPNAARRFFQFASQKLGAMFQKNTVPDPNVLSDHPQPHANHAPQSFGAGNVDSIHRNNDMHQQQHSARNGHDSQRRHDFSTPDVHSDEHNGGGHTQPKVSQRFQCFSWRLILFVILAIFVVVIIFLGGWFLFNTLYAYSSSFRPASYDIPPVYANQRPPPHPTQFATKQNSDPITASAPTGHATPSPSSSQMLLIFNAMDHLALADSWTWAYMMQNFTRQYVDFTYKRLNSVPPGVNILPLFGDHAPLKEDEKEAIKSKQDYCQYVLHDTVFKQDLVQTLSNMAVSDLCSRTENGDEFIDTTIAWFTDKNPATHKFLQSMFGETEDNTESNIGVDVLDDNIIDDTIAD